MSNGDGIERVLKIISKKAKEKEHFAVVLSARGTATDQLESMLKKAANSEDFNEELEFFENYQKEGLSDTSIIADELKAVEKILKGVSLTGDFSPKTKDELMAYGEVISGKTVTALLQQSGINAQLLDSRTLIKTDDAFTNAEVDEGISKENVIWSFKNLEPDVVPIVTGFIASNSLGGNYYPGPKRDQLFSRVACQFPGC